jgi:molecular chaperone GrpE
VVGRPYDPNTAEATDMEITPNPDDDQKVIAEARAGYKLKDRIIRPARVKVAKYVAPAQA